MTSKRFIISSIGAFLTITAIAPGASAWESWERTFSPGSGIELKKMGQDQANQYCRGRFEDLKKTGDLNPGFLVHVNHVWAHLEANQCVYNITGR